MAIIWKMPKFVMKITFFSLLTVPVANKFFRLVKTAIPVLKNNSKLKKPYLFSHYQTHNFYNPLTTRVLPWPTDSDWSHSFNFLSVESTDGIWAEYKSWFALSKWFEFSPYIFLTKLNQDGDLSNLVIYLIYHKMFVLLCKISFSTCTSTMIHLVPPHPPPPVPA